MRKLSVISFFILIFQCSNAQQYNNWYFGLGAGITFNHDSTIVPHALTDGVNTAFEGNCSISDSGGHLLFYTNGETVYNRNHQVMLNGDNLMGNHSAVQSSIIIPQPGTENIYYIFTTDAYENNFANGYRYSIVNMNLDGGNGGIVTKNILLNASCTERLTAARDANGVDVWIIGNENYSNVFKAWHLTCAGLQLIPVVSTVGAVLNQYDYVNLGMIKVSPDGKQLCQTHRSDYDNLFSQIFFQLFDFDNATGMLSNPIMINVPTCSYYGCEFSPDSKLLYLTRIADTITDQFEPKLPTAADITASRINIPSEVGFYGIQTGPDGKIYLDNIKSKLSVISKPNVKGLGCTFEADKINLGNNNGELCLPSAINDGPVDPYNDFTYQIIDSCTGLVQFNGTTNMAGPIQWSWDFGDGTTSLSQNPQHIFTPAGQIYIVKMTIKSSAACTNLIHKTKAVTPVGISIHVDFDFVFKCDSGYVRFINNSSISPDSSVQFIWDFGDGITSTTQSNPIHSYTGAGTFNVKLLLKTSTVCLNDSIIKNVSVQQFNIQAIPHQATIDAGQTIQLNVTGGGTGFTWSPPIWLTNAHIQSPVAKPEDNITYIVTATNDSGCKATDSVFINVKAVDSILIPTAFTPNNDGKNDTFKPSLGFHFTLQNFSIYNRWGQQLFSTSEKGVGWNGKFNEKEQNPGVYIWLLKAIDRNGIFIEKKGTVVLIR